MPKSSEPFFNVRVIEEVEGKEKVNKFLELGWKLLGPPLVKKKGHPDVGFEDVPLYCLGWCSASLRPGDKPPYPKD